MFHLVEGAGEAKTKINLKDEYRDVLDLMQNKEISRLFGKLGWNEKAVQILRDNFRNIDISDYDKVHQTITKTLDDIKEMYPDYYYNELTKGLKLDKINEAQIRVTIDEIKVSDNDMYQLKKHYIKHGAPEMGYEDEVAYNKAAQEFVKENLKNSNAKIEVSNFTGSAKGGGDTTKQILIKYDNKTAVIDFETGQIIDFFKGYEASGNVNIREVVR